MVVPHSLLFALLLALNTSVGGGAHNELTVLDKLKMANSAPLPRKDYKRSDDHHNAFPPV